MNTVQQPTRGPSFDAFNAATCWHSKALGLLGVSIVFRAHRNHATIAHSKIER
ncbi:Uncharacterised protein [Vibrio cholerae]|nr:Uncharacterised protein [Vibrio cholerae]CSI58665.1 Uncharacterised protein [Vibrio cholerae]